MKLTCILIEDEPLAADVMHDYIRQVPFLDLRGSFTDALASLPILQQEKIDLMFLDIHLPGLKGLDFLRTLKNSPAVILTTAYHEYALEGFDLSVTDYLLKPVAFDRFLAAVNKVARQNTHEQSTITLHADKRTVVIPVNDILFIESQKEYIAVHTSSAKYVSKYALSKIEQELDPTRFLRVHRSFIIALPQIKSFNVTEIEIPGKVIPVGRNYRDQVTEKLAHYFR